MMECPKISKCKINTLEVAGIVPAIKGMRNPMNSWTESDTVEMLDKGPMNFDIGPKDLELAKKLVKAGNEHGKFLRQIQVWADVSMPRYWWVEADTYSFGTTNSCSTMHKLLSSKEHLTVNDFEYDEMNKTHIQMTVLILQNYKMDYCRHLYNGDTENMRKTIRRAKQILPESYIQKRTWNTNYQELMNIYHQRKHHKLTEEWVDVFGKWVKTLPYFHELCIATREG